MERCANYESLEVYRIDPKGRPVPENLTELCPKCRAFAEEDEKLVPEPKTLRDDIVWKALELAGYRCQCQSGRGCHGPKSPKALF